MLFFVAWRRPTSAESRMWTAPASVDSGWLGGFFLFHLLVVDRRQVVERGVQSERVVEGLDVVEDCGAGFAAVEQGAATEQVLRQRGEEALGDGVVVGRGSALWGAEIRFTPRGGIRGSVRRGDLDAGHGRVAMRSRAGASAGLGRAALG
jgi:hypothetical protein